MSVPALGQLASPSYLGRGGNQLKAAGLMSEVFTFVDATHLIAKATLWEEPDKARQQKIEKLNNDVLPKVAGGYASPDWLQGQKEVLVWL